MRVWIALVLVASLAVASGCEESSDPTEERSETSMGAPQPAGTTYHATVEVETEQVVVRWHLTNDGDRELLVADGIPVVAGAGVRFQRDSAYVIPSGRSVELSQRVFPWPDTDKTWVTAPRIGITRIAAGDTLSRTVTVPRPLAPHHPFGTDLGDGELSLPTAPEQVAFCLGVIAPPLKPAAALQSMNGVETVVHGQVPFESQHLFCSDPVPFS